MSKALRVGGSTNPPRNINTTHRKTCIQKNFLHKIFINNYKIPSFASTTKMSKKHKKKKGCLKVLK